MQTRPDHPTLLDALATFLLGDVSPKLEADKALQFRVLIAANLATIVAGELRSQGERLTAELGRLRALLHDDAGAPDVATLERLNRELAARIRRGAVDGGEFADTLEHLLRTARETLEVTNPRFELE